jgi:hypothetical protein
MNQQAQVKMIRKIPTLEDNVFYVTSVANLRRREVMGVGNSFEDKEAKNLKRRKEKSIGEPKTKKANLKDTQEMIRTKMSVDERGIKN